MPERDPYQDLLDESRHREALEERARERSLDAQLHGDARFAGTLTDLAEHGTAVTARTVSGATHQGWLDAVAVDHLLLTTPDGHRVRVRLDAVTDVRPEPGITRGAAAGDRVPSVDRTMTEVLARVVDERPRVHLRLAGQPHGLSGRLLAVGADVLSLRPDGQRGVAYVNVATVTELAIDP